MAQGLLKGRKKAGLNRYLCNYPLPLKRLTPAFTTGAILHTFSSAQIPSPSRSPPITADHTFFGIRPYCPTVSCAHPLRGFYVRIRHPHVIAASTLITPHRRKTPPGQTTVNFQNGQSPYVGVRTGSIPSEPSCYHCP